MLSFGDPGPFSSSVRDSGATLIVQVTDRDEARRALDVGADIVVAQGTEAGGNGGQRSTLPFVPAVVDLAAPTPVLAAGGVADGRGLAAALALGAAGALVGTRFQASQEALANKAILEAIVEGNGDNTSGATCSISLSDLMAGPVHQPRCATHLWTSGRTKRENWPPTKKRWPTTGRRCPSATPPPSRCGPARPST